MGFSGVVATAAQRCRLHERNEVSELSADEASTVTVSPGRLQVGQRHESPVVVAVGVSALSQIWPRGQV